MPNKTVMFFQNSFGYGWSEVAYYGGAFNFLDIKNALTARFAQRLRFLAGDCIAVYARITGPISRDPIVVNLQTQLAGNQGLHPNPSSTDFTRVLFEETSGNIGFNRTFLGGIPFNCVTGDRLTFDNPFLQGINGYQNYLVGAGITWQVYNTMSTPKQFFPITTITLTPPRGWSFVCPQLTLNTGDIVEVHRATKLGFNGRKMVTSVTTAGGITTYNLGGAVPQEVEPPGTAIAAAKVVYSQGNITQAQSIKATRRGAGRPFGLRAGRRRTLFSLRQ